jgi:hypothetical protein
MREREQLIEDLTSRDWPRWEAELVADDHDLWMVEPGVRYAFEPEEAVRQWQQAVRYLHDLVGMGAAGSSSAIWFNEATSQALQDAEARAREALRRAQERLQSTE